MKRLVMIKFGGGLITDKEKPYTARKIAIRRLAKSVAALRRQMPDTHFIVGNGAGSFGHFGAHHYGLREGAHTPAQFYGMAKTHAGVQKLNTLVVEALLAEEVPAFSLAPSSFLFCNDKQVASTFFKPLFSLLEQGLLPVVYGDTITDAQRGTTILSTEKVLFACAQELRQHFKTITAVYIFGANGVLDADGKTIPVLTSGTPITPLHTLEHDVTGGIAGKVDAARMAATVADAVYLIGSDPADLAAVVHGKQAGTRVLNDAVQ